MPSDNIADGESLQEKLKILGHDNIQDFMRDGYKTLMEAIKHSNNLPQNSDWNFYNTHDSFVKIINEETGNILKQINSLLRTNHIEANIRNRGLEEKTKLLVEGNDNILERVANNIDEMNGIRKTGNAPILIQSVSAQLPVNGSWNRLGPASFSVNSSVALENTSTNSESSANAIRLLTAKNIIRPQTFFKDKIINSSNFPWEPRIKEKPNSLKPLAIFLEETENGREYSHPYEFELDRFQPLPEQLKMESPIKPLPIEDTPLVEVNTPADLEDLVETLRNCQVFAVDVEHHSYRSFMGITCLLQISTREKDYLVDTLALRDKLWLLNEVFTKPTIVKVFHGADLDIKWLQRDLSIYVVNLFDTYQAAKHLGLSGLSLAYLMQIYCNFAPNKQFQLADWRIRPLPDELKKYAREDTHYLLYIYQMLKNELLDKGNGADNHLLSVIGKSTEVCKQRYFKPVLTDESYMDFYRKCKRTFDNRQLFALKELYKWRDLLSREEDESTGYVLPNHMLLQIAESLPREMQGILACCNPIPPLVRANLLELHQIILKAKEQPLEKPIFKEDTRARGSTKKMSKINVDSPLNCPHDLTKSEEFRDDLPTVLGNSFSHLANLPKTKLEMESTKPLITVFQSPEDIDEEMKIVKEKVHSFNFMSPYERYKLVKPYIQAEEKKLAKEAAEKSSEVQIVEEADGRTDEQRIESIRELFLTLSKQGPPNAGPQEPERSLVQMGGTKRKREHLSSVNDQQGSVDPLMLPFSTTISPDDVKNKNKNNQNKNQWKKKNRNWQGNAPQGEQEASFSGSHGNNQQFEGNAVENRQRGKKHNRQGFKNKNRGGQNNRQQNMNNQQRKGNRQIPSKKAQGDHNQPNQRNNSNNGPEFTAFDYSSVDFRQFQGGAGTVSKPQEVKSTVRFKGKKKSWNGANNKSATFTANPQNGGLGRGRR